MRILKKISDFVSWHRRGLAAVLAVLAVLSLAAHLTEPPPDQTQVVRVTRQVGAGAPITRGDVEVVAVEGALAPSQALRTLDEVVGQHALTTLTPGTLLQESLLLTSHRARPGHSLVPISIQDAGLQALLSPGTLITLALPHAEGADIVTDRAVVMATPPPDAGSNLSPTVGSTAMILVEVPSGDAIDVAVLGQQATLAVILGGNSSG